MTREDRKQCVEWFAGEYDYTIECIQPWHLRLSHPSGKRLDYFPKSGRATRVSSNKYFTIPDIEQFITESWQATNQNS
jgi:hypothetical protein